MVKWVNQGMQSARVNLVMQGFNVPMAIAPVHVRFLGRPAASGRRQAIFTTQCLATARAGYQSCWNWWTAVPEEVDERGWRMVSCRWYIPRDA